jgi:lipoprotein-releasing system permease protein
MYKAFLSLRYLKTRYIALASIVSVMLGVATMIVVNGVMKGFTSEMRNRIQGLLSDIVIESNSLDGQPDAPRNFELVRSVAGDKIAGMTATVEVWGLMSFEYHGQWQTRPITLIGIVPEQKDTVGPLRQYLESYRDTRDGDKVLRPALRSFDVRPSWELTDEGRTWREKAVEERKWQEQFDHPIGTPPISGAAGSAVTPVSHAETPGRTPVVAQSPQTPSDKNADPFAPPEMESPPPIEANTAPADEAALMPARLYVGAGLIRFPHEDPKTGKIDTIEMVRPGDDVKISTVKAGRPPDKTSFDATVVDIFKCGMSEYDSNLVFCNLEALQEVRMMIDHEHPNDQRGKAITSIQIKLKDFADAPEVIERLQAVFSPGIWTIKTWEQKQGPLLQAVEIETGILNVLLFLIIAVAGFGILAIFYMIVVEKTRDIGVLKALGASSSGVMSIFLSYGLALGVVGSGVGVMLGLLFVRYINEIESTIAHVTGRKVFDDKVYYFPKIPTLVEPSTVVWVTLGAMAIAVLASVLPARRASALRPVEALRYE